MPHTDDSPLFENDPSHAVSQLSEAESLDDSSVSVNNRISEASYTGGHYGDY